MENKVLVIGACRIENILYSKTYPLEDSELDTDIDEEFRIGGTATDVCRRLRALHNIPFLLSTVPNGNPIFEKYLPDVGIGTTLCATDDGRPAWSTIVVNERENSITSFDYPGELPYPLQSPAACNRIKDFLPDLRWVHIEDLADHEDPLACLRELRHQFAGDVKISVSIKPENAASWLRHEILALSKRGEEVRIKCCTALPTRKRLHSYANFVGSAIHFLASGMPLRDAMHSLLNDTGTISDIH